MPPSTTDSTPARFEVPAPRRTVELRLQDGATVVLRRHGNPAGPRLLMSHGNGFAVDMYYPLWSRFLRDFDVVLFDLRNHGWNPVGHIGGHNVPQFAADIDAIGHEVERRFGGKPTVGVYHSVSALSICLSESRGEGYDGLFLLDPPVCKPGRTYEELDAAAERSARMTLRREVGFESLAQFVELLEFSMQFQKVVDGVRELVARTTLRPDGDNRFVLRCPREYEARIVEYLTVFAVAVDFTKMRCPIQVLGADPTVPYSYLPSFQLDAIMACNYDFLPEATHMLFVERPGYCADRIREFVAECGIKTP